MPNSSCRYVYCIYDVERLHNLSDFISFFHVRGLHFEVFRMTRYGSIRGEFRNDIDYTCAHQQYSTVKNPKSSLNEATR